MNCEQICLQMAAIFHKYADSDGDCSSLSQPELMKLAKSEFPTLCKSEKGDDILKLICSSMDLNGDKMITFDEFCMFNCALTTALHNPKKAGGKK
ncbi:protein S100-G-like [Ambystoma mexicanum]|uniref:protein S100-G-like n=1 Tax=Ambystoma mexicanum TaxID=8296 RepID=UPI0037E6F827